MPVTIDLPRAQEAALTTQAEAQGLTLAPAMRVHGVPSILTFNTGDSTRFTGITVVDPALVR